MHCVMERLRSIPLLIDSSGGFSLTELSDIDAHRPVASHGVVDVHEALADDNFGRLV